MNRSEVTLLVVEDEPDLREITAELVRSSGYRCLEARNGCEALKHIHVERIDIVLSDIQMPILDGTQLLKILQKSGFCAPFIFLTGTSNFEERYPSLVPSVYKVLEKPVCYSLLFETIDSAVQSLPMLSQPTELSKAGDNSVVKLKIEQALRELLAVKGAAA